MQPAAQPNGHDPFDLCVLHVSNDGDNGFGTCGIMRLSLSGSYFRIRKWREHVHQLFWMTQEQMRCWPIGGI